MRQKHRFFFELDGQILKERFTGFDGCMISYLEPIRAFLVIGLGSLLNVSAASGSADLADIRHDVTDSVQQLMLVRQKTMDTTRILFCQVVGVKTSDSMYHAKVVRATDDLLMIKPYSDTTIVTVRKDSITFIQFDQYPNVPRYLLNEPTMRLVQVTLGVAVASGFLVGTINQDWLNTLNDLSVRMVTYELAYVIGAALIIILNRKSLNVRKRYELI